MGNFGVVRRRPLEPMITIGDYLFAVIRQWVRYTADITAPDVLNVRTHSTHPDYPVTPVTEMVSWLEGGIHAVVYSLFLRKKGFKTHQLDPLSDESLVNAAEAFVSQPEVHHELDKRFVDGWQMDTVTPHENGMGVYIRFTAMNETECALV